MSNIEQLYTEEEKLQLMLSYGYHTRTGSKSRDVANALKGQCKNEIGIIKAYYPYQTPEGRPLKKGRDKVTGKQIWKTFRITMSESERIMKKCLFAYIDHKYGDPIQIEYHEDGDLVEE